jgi:PPOX class probable F420-dependent enzyme
MGDPVMTDDERTAFLTDVRVGVLAIERPGKGPLAHPIWYVYDGTDVLITMEATSAKATLLRRAGRATMVVQDEAPPYRYVSVEGPVTIAPAAAGDGYDLREVAIRYLGVDAGNEYADGMGDGFDAVTVRLHPERWLTVDYGKDATG